MEELKNGIYILKIRDAELIRLEEDKEEDEEKD